MKNTVIIHLCALTALFVACSTEPHDYEHHRTSYFKNLHLTGSGDSVLVCATFNIQLGFQAGKNPWDKTAAGADSLQIERIAAMIGQVDADIVALQEVPLNRSNAVIKDFLDKLAVRLEMNYAFGSHGFNDPDGIYPVHGEWGNAVLSKYPISGIQNIQVSYASQWQKRSILITDITVNEKVRLNVVSYHYDNSLGQMNEGIRNTRAHLSQLKDKVILMGDSNYQWDVRDYAAEFIGLGLIDADSTSLTGIDRILFSGDAFRCSYVQSWYDTIHYTSDHPLNYCRLLLTGQLLP